jgi:glycosyltransferase involved in cell wall biosynthesis
MKVSVLIPTYNRAYIIGEALASALNQSYRDLEIIVVDDGSSDDTVEIVRKMRSENIRYIRHPRNRGYSAACNTAISAATGAVVGFLDSDDLWKPDYLERLTGLLASHEELGGVFCDTEIVRQNQTLPSLIGLMKCFPKLLATKEKAESYVLSSREMYLCLLEEVPIKPSAALLRREVLSRVGMFNEAWPSGTDWELFLRISRQYPFGYVNRPLAIQRICGDSTYLGNEVRDKTFLLQVFTREKLALNKDHAALAAVRRGLSNHCSDLAYLYLRSGKRLKSIPLYYRAFRETADFGMLVRGAAALLPLGVRDCIRRIVRASLLKRPLTSPQAEAQLQPGDLT